MLITPFIIDVKGLRLLCCAFHIYKQKQGIEKCNYSRFQGPGFKGFPTSTLRRQNVDLPFIFSSLRSFVAKEVELRRLESEVFSSFRRKQEFRKRTRYLSDIEIRPVPRLGLLWNEEL